MGMGVQVGGGGVQDSKFGKNMITCYGETGHPMAQQGGCQKITSHKFAK